MSEDESVLVAVVSDIHINSVFGVCPPVINLDEGTYHASTSQRWLWDCWNHFWRYVKERGEGKRIIAFVNGDLGELDTKRHSNELITPNKAVIIEMVNETIQPMVNVAERVVFMRGTPAHVGKSSWLEEDVASDCVRTVPSSKTNSSWMHFRGKISNVRFDIAHHGSMSKRPHTKANSAIRLATDTIMHYSDGMNAQLPDVVIRSHMHSFAESGMNHRVHAFFTPCWQLPNEFAYRVGHENTKVSIGGLLFDCKGRDYIWEKQLYEPKELQNLWKRSL